MIAASDFPSDVHLRVVNGDSPTTTITTGDGASFAQSLGSFLQIAGGPFDKSKATADAAILHAELGMTDPQSLQAKIGTLFGVRPVVLTAT